jgi:Zn-finger nucleic acid-binding protein
MNCENCGAPMTVYPNRDYFTCEYCGSFHIPAESEEGVRVLDQTSEEIGCPVCQTTLHHAKIEKFRVYHCPNCHGNLAGQDTFVNIIKYRRSRAVGLADIPQPLDPAELERETYCPLCAQLMSTHPYYGPGNIVIDLCLKCRVLWLDHGELGKVVDAPGRDRGKLLLDRLIPIDDDAD